MLQAYSCGYINICRRHTDAGILTYRILEVHSSINILICVTGSMTVDVLT
jgi:hypothetical protein